MSARYAVYFAPEAGSALHDLGARWLQRDADTGRTFPAPSVPGLTAHDVAAATASARLYGFHATLKAPFRLAEGQCESALAGAADAFAASRRGFRTPPLNVELLGGQFFALTLQEGCAPMRDLADDCVRAFDRFRAPLADREIARRRQAGLSREQDALLLRWGYPYVFDQFLFHMTLCDAPADRVQRDAIAGALGAIFKPIAGSGVAVNAICLFRQPEPGAPFTVWRRCRFA